MARYRSWMKTFFTTGFLLMLLVALFNYNVDSIGLFHEQTGLAHMVASLYEGRMIAAPIDYDEREFQTFLIEHNPRKPDVIAIGSSRTMELRKSMFARGGEIFMNHSMAAASLEDYIGIVGVYRARRFLPRLVILGVDPWVFNRNNGLSRWRSFGPYYSAMVDEIYGKESAEVPKKTRYGELINFDYTVANVRYLKKDKRGTMQVVNDPGVDDFVREPDGSIHFPYPMRYRRDEDTRRLAAIYPGKREGFITNFETITNTRLFEDFVRYLEAQCVEVVFFLPPFHPITFDRLRSRYPSVQEVERYLRRFAAAEHIPVLGSYDPGLYGLHSTDFFDGSHAHSRGLEKILSRHTLW